MTLIPSAMISGSDESKRSFHQRNVQFRYDKTLYRERNWIERVIGHLKINRAVATRYDQLAETFLGMLYLAAARYWMKFVHAA
jgi:transposase